MNYKLSINWTWWVITKIKVGEGGASGRIWGRIEGEYDQNTSYDILKSNKILKTPVLMDFIFLLGGGIKIFLNGRCSEEKNCIWEGDLEV